MEVPTSTPTKRDVKRAALGSVIANTVALLIVLGVIELDADTFAQLVMLTNALLTGGMLLTENHT